MPSIYIINPRCPVPGYFTAEAFANEHGGRTQVADLAIVTVAALVPADWDVRVTDEDVSPVDFDCAADFIAITGKVSQRRRMIEIAAAFRRRGQTVIIGGSFASLSPDEMRPHADILVTGELEELAPKLFADLRAGRWSDRYDGGQADIRRSPLPRWDLYPVRRAVAGALQTTRGCPFNCEFCDVIQYQGRKQRHKTIDQVLAELSLLHSHGFRNVFLVDDNFTVHRRFARDMLVAIADWNAARGRERISFQTQASLDIARDEDMLALCHAAGMRAFFMGVETINEDSLRETGKLQNLLMPMRDAINRIVSAGIAVQAGVIVGFDHDGPATFDRLLDFLQESPLPDLSVGVLTAPATTPLYHRLAKEGRLAGDIWNTSAGSPFETNIEPARMSRQALVEGTLALCAELYGVENYRVRMLNLIRQYGGTQRAAATRTGAERKHTFSVLRQIGQRGSSEAGMVSDILRAAAEKPAVLPTVMYMLSRYEQARRVLDHAAAA